MKSETLLLIDGHNYLFRSFYVPFHFKTGKGTPLHVVSTFLKLLRRSVRAASRVGEVKQVGVIFDSDNLTFRKQLLDEYKAGRVKFGEDEDSPYKHIPIVQRALKELEIFSCRVLDIFDKTDIEADDLIASVAKSSQDYRRVIISSADTDFYQSIDEKVTQLQLKKRERYQFVTVEYIRSKLSVDPSNYVFYKSLKGDSADNIKGIPGIGPKRAARIISGEYNLDLEPYKDLLELNQKLIKFKKVEVDPQLLKQMVFKKSSLDRSNPEIFRCCDF
jgi:DNA polymerase-1